MCALPLTTRFKTAQNIKPQTKAKDAVYAAHTTSSCCWHCCEEVVHAVPLPRVYDTAEKAYFVYGVTCSPSCAKAYVLEHTTFDRGQHLDLLVQRRFESARAQLGSDLAVRGAAAELPGRGGDVRRVDLA